MVMKEKVKHILDRGEESEDYEQILNKVCDSSIPYLKTYMFL